ncbi:MAG: hypothetical protein MI865_09155 [Proteobacteria bacterium]|nr:hypothetical protein [Pseudomonadota bacterium]
MSLIMLVLAISTPSPAWSEQCLNIGATVKWNGLPVEVITLLLPFTTRGPRSFVGGRGFDFSARFETEINSDGKVVLKSLLSGTRDLCNDKSAMTHILESVTQLNAGYITCGENRYHLLLDVRGISESYDSCW